MRQNWATRREGSAAAHTQSRGYQAHMRPPATLQLPGTTAGQMVHRQLCAPHAAPAHAAGHSPFIDGLPLERRRAPAQLCSASRAQATSLEPPRPTLSTPAQRLEGQNHHHCQQCPLSKQTGWLGSRRSHRGAATSLHCQPRQPACQVVCPWCTTTTAAAKAHTSRVALFHLATIHHSCATSACTPTAEQPQRCRAAHPPPTPPLTRCTHTKHARTAAAAAGARLLARLVGSVEAVAEHGKGAQGTLAGGQRLHPVACGGKRGLGGRSKSSTWSDHWWKHAVPRCCIYNGQPQCL